MEKVIKTGSIPIKLWLADIEEGALQQAENLAQLPFVYQHIALMPDCHQGFGVPIGCVFAAENAVIPNAVGVDIGCGMCAARFDFNGKPPENVLRQIVAGIQTVIPMGFKHHQQAQPWDGFQRAPRVPVIQAELNNARTQLGTLGSGNHFIEIQQDDEDHLWAMVHSGSRNFGLKIAQEYHRRAQSLCAARRLPLPNNDLAYLPLDSADAQEYLAAMNFALDFARMNRTLMMDRVGDVLLQVLGVPEIERLDIHHNFAARETHFGKEVIVHRKGATRAFAGQLGIIPGSMGTASYIVRGLGNPESFLSCSHGAGRRMGRKAAQRTLDLKKEQARMKGIVHGLHSNRDLDEAPGSYKDIDVVMDNQKDLVTIEVSLRPIASMKG